MTRLACAVVAAVTFGSLPLTAADLSGQWTAMIGGPIYVTFQQNGSRLSGSGGPSLKDPVLKFDDVKVEGDRVTFKAGPFEFDLKIEGDTMKGSARSGEQTMPAFFKRVQERPAGAPLPTFEVASVKQAPAPSMSGLSSTMRTDPGRLICTNVTLRKLIITAYSIRDYELTGPDWINTELYDVTARIPPNSSGEDMQLMIQSLLAERFNLAMHRETKDLPVYALLIGKNGSRLKPVEFGPANTSASPGKMKATRVPIRSLTDFLSRQVSRPVLDETGLQGVFDYSLEWTPEPKASAPGEADHEIGPSLFTAIQEQLGLKLEARKAPLEMLVIDRAERVPTGN